MIEHGSDPEETIKKLVNTTTNDSTTIGDFNPKDTEKYMNGDKEQTYRVEVEDLRANNNGIVVVELMRESESNWKAEVIGKTGI